MCIRDRLHPKLQAGGAGEIPLRPAVRLPLRSRPKPVSGLDELARVMPPGMSSPSMPGMALELPPGMRQPGVSVGKLRSQLRGHGLGLAAQLTPLGSEAGSPRGPAKESARERSAAVKAAAALNPGSVGGGRGSFAVREQAHSARRRGRGASAPSPATRAADEGGLARRIDTGAAVDLGPRARVGAGI